MGGEGKVWRRGDKKAKHETADTWFGGEDKKNTLKVQSVTVLLRAKHYIGGKTQREPRVCYET